MHLVCTYIIPYIMYLLVFPLVQKMFEPYFGIFSIFYPDFSTMMFRIKANIAFHIHYIFLPVREN